MLRSSRRLSKLSRPQHLHRSVQGSRGCVGGRDPLIQGTRVHRSACQVIECRTSDSRLRQAVVERSVFVRD